MHALLPVLLHLLKPESGRSVPAAWHNAGLQGDIPVLQEDIPVSQREKMHLSLELS